nr:MAG TPA: hypothetical protein [Siphoviridae sp. ctQHO9]
MAAESKYQILDHKLSCCYLQMVIIFITKIAYESKYPIAFELSFCFTCPPISPSITRASAAVAITFKAISISPILKAVFLFESFHFIYTHTEDPGRFIRIRMSEIFSLLWKHEPEHGIVCNITQVFKVSCLFKLGKAHFQTFDCIDIPCGEVHSCRSVFVIRLFNQTFALFIKCCGILGFHQCFIHCLNPHCKVSMYRLHYTLE